MVAQKQVGLLFRPAIDDCKGLGHELLVLGLHAMLKIKTCRDFCVRCRQNVGRLTLAVLEAAKDWLRLL